MESKSHYTLIGLAVLFLTASLICSAIWLSVGFDPQTYNKYIIYVNEPVSGLNDDAPVKYNGVRVGYIEDIHLSSDDPQLVKIIVNIAQGIPITVSTQASLISQGITGSTFLGLNATSNSLVALQPTANEPYPVIPYTPSFFFRMEKNINHISEQLNTLFTPENSESITKTLHHLEKLSQIFEKNTHNIDQSLKDLPNLVDALEISAIRVDVMARDVSVASKQFTQTMLTGKNTIEQLSQQTIPSFALLIRHLDNIATNIQVLSSQLRQNPAVIVRGTIPQKPGPGEKP